MDQEVVCTKIIDLNLNNDNLESMNQLAEPLAEDVNNKEKFYQAAAQYWADIPATIDGMLGGFGYISQTDIHDSKLLLKQIFASKNPPSREYALDCGAGIGRITKHLLGNFFDQIDLVEQDKEFLEQAKTYLGPNVVSKIGNYFQVGLQDFLPEGRKYDVIWSQWVLSHLTDSDLIKYLENCKKGLKDNGVVVIKENISSTGELEHDKLDSSVTRPLSLFHEIFKKSGLICYRQLKQRNFPKGLFTVYMFVLKPSVPE